MNSERLANLKSEVSKQFSGTTKYSKAFRRSNTQALDISQTFPTFEHAFVYALNDTENDNYVPYAGQVVSEAENGNVYILRKYSTDVKYIDLPTGEGETLESYEIKNTDRFHYYLQEIKTVDGDNPKYLRADTDSDNEGHTLTVGKLVSQKGADVTGNVNVTGDVNATGNVTGNNVTATGKVKTPEVVTDGIHSEGADAQNGFIIGKEASGGYTMYVDNLHVRNKMTAETLEIQETTYVGGKLVLTPGAGIECSKVEYGSFPNGQGFKCWFVNELDGKKKYNTFQVGDLALCENFNNNRLKFYWREVAECGDDYIILSDVNGRYHADSDEPEAGDKIVQCGNINGGERASAIVLSALDLGSPFVAQYKNIVTFEWTEPVTKLSEDGNIITGTLKTDSGKDVEKYINDTNDTIVKLQEGMQSLGDDNFVIWQADYPSPKTDAGTINEELSWDSWEPSMSWAAADLNSHTGDYLVCSDGIVYVFRCVDVDNSEYIWKIVTDKYLIDALNKALQAQDTANSAQETANSAVEQLNKIANDGIITLQEKLTLKSIWKNVQATYNQLMAEAVKYSVNSDSYKTAYDALNILIDIILAIPTDYTLTNADDYPGKWSAYYDAESELYSAIVAATKKLADDAQTTADGAVATLNNMASDNIITLQEKLSLKSIWENVQATYDQLVAEASKYSVNRDNYSIAYENLRTLIEEILASTSDYTLDTNKDYSGKWSKYYEEESKLYSAIVVAAKKVADDAKKVADEAQKVAGEANTSAGNAMKVLNDMANDGIITAQEKISLKDWWNNELNEANSIIANAQKIYGNIEDSNANWYKFSQLLTLAETLMNNVLNDMKISTNISASGSIFVTKDAVQTATKDTSIQGSLRADENLVWSEFWAIYYQYKATCQNTAEAKAKVFITAENVLPTPPYKKGDMWICPKYTHTTTVDGNATPITYIKETFVCKNEKESGKTAEFGDWEVMYDKTSSHLEVLKDSIKLWVEKDSGVAKKIQSGIDLLAEGVKIYHTKSDGTKEQINLISVGEDGIKINASLIDIDTPEFTLKGKTIDLTADDIKINSTYFKVSKYGNITATGGTIGGYEINSNGIRYRNSDGSNQIWINQNQIWVGNSSSTDKFVNITADGKITAKDVDLSGKITATSGRIANMDINANYVEYAQELDSTTDVGDYFQFGYDGIKSGYVETKYKTYLDAYKALDAFMVDFLAHATPLPYTLKSSERDEAINLWKTYKQQELNIFNEIRKVYSTSDLQKHITSRQTELQAEIDAWAATTTIDADGKTHRTNWYNDIKNNKKFIDGLVTDYPINQLEGYYQRVVTTTITKDGAITAPNVEFKKDGSGHIAGGKIAWDKYGNFDARDGSFQNVRISGFVRKEMIVITRDNYYDYVAADDVFNNILIDKTGTWISVSSLPDDAGGFDLPTDPETMRSMEGQTLAIYNNKSDESYVLVTGRIIDDVNSISPVSRTIPYKNFMIVKACIRTIEGKEDFCWVLQAKGTFE